MSIPDFHIPNPVKAIEGLFTGGNDKPTAGTSPDNPSSMYKDSAVQYLIQSYGLSKKDAEGIWAQWYNDSGQHGAGGHIDKDHALASTIDLDAVVGKVKQASPVELKKQAQLGAATAAKQQAQVAGNTGAANQAQALIDSINASGKSQVQLPKSLGDVTGGRDLTDDEVKKAIETYNATNPQDQIKTRDDLYQRITYGNINALSAAAVNTEGEVGGFRLFKVWDPGTMTMRNVQIDSQRFDAIAQANPTLIASLPKVIGTSSRTGEQLQPAMIAAALNVMGLQNTHDQKGLTGRASFEDEPGIGNNALRSASQSFQDMFHKYNDETLALLALKNQGLADAIFNQGGVNSDQAKQVKQFLVGLGYASAGEFVTSMAKQGVAIDESKLSAMLAPGGGTTGNNGNAIQVTLPDPAKLGEGVRQLWRAWFQRDPTSQEIDSYAGQIAGLIQGKAQDLRNQMVPANIFKGVQASGPSQTVVSQTDVDPQSRLLQDARASTDYKQLFSAKQQGLTEEEFANQFKQAGANFQGGLPDDRAVRAGMMSGDVNTTLGYVAGSASAKDSSTFQERLAKSAQAIARFT